MNTINLETDDPGMELRMLRIKNRYSMQLLGEAVGVSHSYIAKIEKNEAKPSDIIIAKLAEVLNVSELKLCRLFNVLPLFTEKLLLKHPALIEALSIVNKGDKKLTEKEEIEFLISVTHLYSQALQNKS
ncbi:helix-turn-helix transcriptional regulator [Priestia megaterium]